MTGRRCRYCDAQIMYVGGLWLKKRGGLWLKKRVADVNGFCLNSPDDLHRPASEAETQGPERYGSLPAARSLSR